MWRIRRQTIRHTPAKSRRPVGERNVVVFVVTVVILKHTGNKRTGGGAKHAATVVAIVNRVIVHRHEHTW